MENKLTTRESLIALDKAIRTWAESTTDPDSLRRRDLERDKANSIIRFVSYVKKHPVEISPTDIRNWRAELERQGLSSATIYAMISKISSFYEWAMRSSMTRHLFQYNPVVLARPKAPMAYQGEKTKALSQHQVTRLLGVVKAGADAGDIVAKRDYALLLFFFETGMRRTEITRLRWGDIEIGDTATITTRIKGGKVLTKEIADERVWRVLFDYLEATGRLETIKDDDPLWARHDRAANGLHDPLSSHGFVKNLKRYAYEAGMEMHLHQTRHTYAHMVNEATGSITATQEALGHEDPETTKVYVSRLSTQKDKHGPGILDAFGIE